MLGLVKKLFHYGEVKDAERLPEDTGFLVLRSGAELPLYRHSFNTVRGAVLPTELLSADETAEITKYVQGKVLPNFPKVEILPLERRISIGGTEKFGFPDQQTIPLNDAVPNVLVHASIRLEEYFAAATGRAARQVKLSVNNTFPARFHEHSFDVMSYTAQGKSTIAQRGDEAVAMPDKNVVLLKPGVFHRAPRDVSYETPRLTFLLS